MGNHNRSLEIDSEGIHLLSPDVAHTRGMTLISHPFDTKIFRGQDFTVAQLKGWPTEIRKVFTISPDERL